ncbi:MAG TPA: hypothetical protein VEA40_12870 [Ramlibacter sp.]|nr:hypothetical protein [Ramlibacter sp.]
MKLVLDTLMIFFGTLIAAGLVALGEPVEEPAAAAPAALPSAATSPR